MHVPAGSSVVAGLAGDAGKSVCEFLDLAYINTLAHSALRI